jgi:hypothetical protein
MNLRLQGVDAVLINVVLAENGLPYDAEILSFLDVYVRNIWRVQHR